MAHHSTTYLINKKQYALLFNLYCTTTITLHTMAHQTTNYIIKSKHDYIILTKYTLGAGF